MLDMIARSMERNRQRSPCQRITACQTEFLIYARWPTRAQDELGYQPIVTLDEGIERHRRPLRDHGNLPR